MDPKPVRILEKELTKMGNFGEISSRIKVKSLVGDYRTILPQPAKKESRVRGTICAMEKRVVSWLMMKKPG
jgi:hypothetical protein